MADPDTRFLYAHPAHWIALAGGVGLAPRAPGTFGSLLAIPLAWACLPLPLWSVWGIIVVAFGLGIWACERTGRDLGVADHGSMVWDEVVAMWGVLMFAPTSWLAWVAAFLLFRLFDIWKPFPIGWCDRRIKGGIGVMLDDALAACYAVMALLLGMYLLNGVRL